MKVLYHSLGVIALITALYSCTSDSGVMVESQSTHGSITQFVIYGNYMYALDQNTVLTYDVTNEDVPLLVHETTTDYGLETIIIYNDNIFIGSTTSLYILDISTPEAPVVLSQTERSEVFQGCDPVVVKDNYAFSTIKIVENRCGRRSSRSALVVFDVSDKTNPVEIAFARLSKPNGLGYKSDYLFVCDEGIDSLRLFDISNPSQMTELPDNSIALEDPIDLIVDRDKMIVSTRTNFKIYDISNPLEPYEIGEIRR